MSSPLDRSAHIRLLAYSTAAGLGAFAFGQTLQAAVQSNTSVNGVHLNGPSESLNLDIDGDGTADAVWLNNGLNTDFLLANNTPRNYNSITSVPGGAILTNRSADGPDPEAGVNILPLCCDGLTYYVMGFLDGDTVGDDNRAAGGGLNVTMWSSDPPYYPGLYFLQYSLVSPGGWVGIRFNISGQTHFGALQVIQQSGHATRDFDGNGSVADPIDFANNPDPVNSTLGIMIWEDQPNTPLVIVPEPASLTLLAAGTGAIGLRRRRA